MRTANSYSNYDIDISKRIEVENYAKEIIPIF
jgi:hypothetical protein